MQLRKAVTMAKTQAITNNTFTTLCRSADGVACNGKWEQGVLMFLDTDGDRKLDKEDTKIAHLRFPKFDGRIYWRAFQNRQYFATHPFRCDTLSEWKFHYMSTGWRPKRSPANNRQSSRPGALCRR
jgi:Tfp pilus assembly protein FimT